LAVFAAMKAAKVAADYGRWTNKCCFCSQGLKDGRSVALGYGPVCAKRWDLPWDVESARQVVSGSPILDPSRDQVSR